MLGVINLPHSQTKTFCCGMVRHRSAGYNERAVAGVGGTACSAGGPPGAHAAALAPRQWQRRQQPAQQQPVGLLQILRHSKGQICSLTVSPSHSVVRHCCAGLQQSRILLCCTMS